MSQEKSVLREVDDEAIRLARTLLRTARAGTLAVLNPGMGGPGVSRVGISTDFDGTPIMLASALAPHTSALLADPRAALLLGEPGKGDPLAHPRISIDCLATPVERDGPDHPRLRARYLAHQPKAKLYVDLGDFRFFRLVPQAASLNGGFGKAYALAADQLVTRTPVTEAIAAREAAAVEHMNEDHADSVAHLARHYLRASNGGWVLAGIEEDGMTLYLGDDVRRIFFETPLQSTEGLHTIIVQMTRHARVALSGTQAS